MIDVGLHPADVVPHDEDNVRLLLLPAGWLLLRYSTPQKNAEPQPANYRISEAVFLVRAPEGEGQSCETLPAAIDEAVSE
jgi:hypothetical protein